MSEEKQAKPPIPVGGKGLQLRTLEDMYRFAQYVASSGLAPKGMERPEAILVALEYGAEIGLRPVQALQNVAVINGRPSIWGDAMLSLCMTSPAWDASKFQEYWEGIPGADDYRAVCQVARKGCPPVVREFSIFKAKRAGLWGKTGPWQTYPERMLQMRARAWALRDAFADVLKGCLAAEEIIGVEPIGVEEQSSIGVDGLARKLNLPPPEHAQEATGEVTEAEKADGETEPTQEVEQESEQEMEQELEPEPELIKKPRRRKTLPGVDDTLPSATESGF